MGNPRILVVDDEENLCDVIAISLRREGYHITTCTNPLQAVEAFRKEPFDIVLQDLRMPQMDGIQLLKALKQIEPASIVIIMTAYSTWDRAVEAMRLGAFGYIRKPFDTNLDLKATMARAVKIKEMQEATSKNFEAIGLMIGDSTRMKFVHDLILRTAPTDSTVIITGESGVGKELVARALHYGSPRAHQPFIAVNCGAFTETLLESELFGHVRGAFTGAVVEKLGLLEVANGGTLFLDEISEMSLPLQVKLLRVLEEKEYKPVGSTQIKSADVRFLSATNKNLEDEVRTGRFRKDLYYRLNIISVRVPSLRERKEDIPLLSGYFLSRFGTLTDKQVKRFGEDAQKALQDYDWPGNIRELENAIQRAVTLCDGQEIRAKDLFDPHRPDTRFRFLRDDGPKELGLDAILGMLRARFQAAHGDASKEIPLEDEIARIEIEYLKWALDAGDKNYTRAAQLLKLSPRSFVYKLKKYGIDRGA